MSKVSFGLGTSLDGFIAGPNAGPAQLLGEGGPFVNGIEAGRVAVSVTKAVHSPQVPHVFYEVERR